MPELAEQYTEIILERLDMILGQMDEIDRAAEMLVNGHLKGGTMTLWDQHWTVSLECWTRGCGLYMPRIYKYGGGYMRFRDNDVLILASIFGDDPKDIKIINELREKNGTKLITILPKKVKGKRKGNVLTHTLADIALDNFSYETGGVLKGKGIKLHFVPASRIINFNVVWALQCQFVQRMINIGRIPTIFPPVAFPDFPVVNDWAKRRWMKLRY